MTYAQIFGMMNVVYVLLVFFLSELLFTLTQAENSVLTNPLLALQPLKREMRYNKVELRFPDKSDGMVVESSFKQYYDKQLMDFHFILNKNTTVTRASFDVIKCKEHYVDCVNIRSFEARNLCTSMDALFYFAKIDYRNRGFNCPLLGEYIFKNVTYDTEKVFVIFNGPTEKWWEYYWKMSAILYNDKDQVFLTVKLHNYFLQYRNRNRKN